MTIILLLTTLFFIVVISDFRNKASIPLLPPPVQLLMVAMYLLPVGILAWTVWTLTPQPLDYLAAALMISGAILSAWSKMTLGSSHVKAGRYKPDALFITSGPYRWMAHPMYAGILLFIAGSAFVVTPRIDTLAMLGYALPAGYVICFLFTSAKTEDAIWRKGGSKTEAARMDGFVAPSAHGRRADLFYHVIDDTPIGVFGEGKKPGD